MSKRHNRKRTRSRPRHRDTAKPHPNHNRTLSMDANFSIPTTFQSLPPSYFPSPLALAIAPIIEPWKQKQQYMWNHPFYHQRELEKAQREKEQMRELRADSLRFFGPHINDDEVSLIEPMLKVVKDLFDGDIDYEDP